MPLVAHVLSSLWVAVLMPNPPVDPARPKEDGLRPQGATAGRTAEERMQISDQQQFENKARAAVRTLEQGALDLADAATLAAQLGDAMACGALHMLRESLFRQIELVEEEISVVDARLADGLAPAHSSEDES